MNGYGEPIECITRLEYIPELPKPSSSQKSFGGWYYDKELSSKAFAGDILDSTITLMPNGTINLMLKSFELRVI